MTSIADLADRIKADNSTLIEGQSDTNKTLDSIDKKFTKFFTLQERARLDNLESKLDASRKRQPNRAGIGFASTAAAVANPFNWLKALTPGNILKGILTVAGVLTIKPALKALGFAAKTLQNAYDDAAKTQRGLNRFTAADLAKKEKLAAKQAALEEKRLKAEQKRLEAERKAAILEEKKRLAQLQAQDRLKKYEFSRTAAAALEEKKRLAQLQAQDRLKKYEFSRTAAAAAEEARIRRLEVEARLEKIKTARTEAGISKKQALANAKLLTNIGNMNFGKQDALLRNIVPTLTTDLPINTSPRAPLMTALEVPNLKAPVVPTRLSVPAPKVLTSIDAPSIAQTATMKLVSPSMAEDLARAGFEAVDTGTSGVRFRSLGPNNSFVAAQTVLDQVNTMKAENANTTIKSKSKIVSGTIKAGVGGLLAVDAALAMAAEVQRAKDQARVLKQAEIESAGLAAVAFAPFALADMGVNLIADGIHALGKAVGVEIERGARLDIYGGLTKDAREDLNKVQEKLGVGQGAANQKLVNAVVGTEKKINTAFENIVGAFTGENKNSGVLAGYENMTAEDYQAMAIAPNVSANSYTYNNGSVVLQQDTPTADPLNGGSAYDFIGAR